MAESEIEHLVLNCHGFLRGHYPRKVQDQLLDIAASPLSLKPSDGYGQGGYVAEFEADIAQLLGKEAAVIMPSGTMAQQIALRIWSDEAGNPAVAYHPTCHLEVHEQMAYRELHHLKAVLIGQPDRLFTLDDLKGLEQPVSTLLIELPQREIGGQLPEWEDLIGLCEYAAARGIRLHLDGARLWECGPFYGRPYREIAAPFDSVYVSLYKILGGLPGAVLAGPADFISKARIWQRRHGGNLVSLAPNAIAGRLGLDRHLPRMAEYVAKAGEIASILRSVEGVRIVPERPPTNMMHVYFAADRDRLIEAAKRIAREDSVLLFLGLPENGKFELTIGNAALDLTAASIRDLFAKLIDLATN